MRKEFFTEIIINTPIGAIIETSEYLDYKVANDLGLLDFKKFIPSSVGIVFKKTHDTEEKWINFLNNSDISAIITHYWIYYKGKIIANGFDFPDINYFDINYYYDLTNNFKGIYDIHFSSDINKGLPENQREIEFINVSEYNGNYSAEIRIEINNEKLNLIFAIEHQDFELFKSLQQELNKNDKLIFKGLYSNTSGCQELGITIKKTDTWINLMISSSKQLISNLIWFQQITKKTIVEKFIVVNK